MTQKINKHKVSAVIHSFDTWIKEHTDYILPSPKYIKDIIPIPYKRWYAGITKLPNGERLLQHLKNNQEFAGLYFKQLNVDTKEQANLVERHFSNLGTKNKPEARGATNESIYAYIFKADANIAEKILILLGI